MEQTSDNTFSIQVQKDFHHTAEAIFDAWTDIWKLDKWMFGPSVREEEIIHLTNDLYPGGKFSYKVKRGDQELDHIGTYLEIDRPTRLVFSWGVDIDSGDDSMVSLDIQPTEVGCTLTLTHDMDNKWAPYADRTKESWTKILNILDERMPL
ncbi:MAG: SRPBCC domain-containing protein [Chitinophaga sp.]|uniref:SRPBCC family protein n=1 Tax=Chitinophaga sp. TaxID=1869181 RepID=UPI0025BFC9D1|nr:SRPBCC family protein [Chitinophaga sp.]MBV8251805.1 SRPBCC domain-containing protein [Chitinophaga sp.]